MGGYGSPGASSLLCGRRGIAVGPEDMDSIGVRHEEGEPPTSVIARLRIFCAGDVRSEGDAGESSEGRNPNHHADGADREEKCAFVRHNEPTGDEPSDEHGN